MNKVRCYMEKKELESLIRFWKTRLNECAGLIMMSPSTVYLLKQTNKGLEELLALDG